MDGSVWVEAQIGQQLRHGGGVVRRTPCSTLFYSFVHIKLNFFNQVRADLVNFPDKRPLISILSTALSCPPVEVCDERIQLRQLRLIR
ncbi:hypothetical protein J6590_035587 [Homalodisca vitripennis]|nr:hypothetical protein J6590_035587 [Homalodisca vitripennis]